MTLDIEILISVYNGELYLEQQIESILAQTYSSWMVVIRDDGSTDSSNEIIEKYIKKYPQKFSYIVDQKGNLGPAKSFEELMRHSVAPYVAFCDQDDVWLPEKLEIQMEVVSQNEVVDERSLLIVSDLVVVDDNLKALSNSYWRYQHLSPKKMNSLERLLVQNFVTGCTCLANRALIVSALPMPDRVIMHDWWLGLVARATGDIKLVESPTVLYRQHSRNDVGAVKWGATYFLDIIKARKTLKDRLFKTVSQAEGLMHISNLSSEEELKIGKYIAMYDRKSLARKMYALRYGYIKYGFFRNLAYLMVL